MYDVDVRRMYDECTSYVYDNTRRTMYAIHSTTQYVYYVNWDKLIPDMDWISMQCFYTEFGELMEDVGLVEDVGVGGWDKGWLIASGWVEE